MESAIKAIVGWFGDVLAVLNSCTFEAYGVEVSLLVIFGTLIVLNMVIGLFWKGAKG